MYADLHTSKHVHKWYVPYQYRMLSTPWCIQHKHVIAYTQYVYTHLILCQYIAYHAKANGPILLHLGTYYQSTSACIHVQVCMCKFMQEWYQRANVKRTTLLVDQPTRCTADVLLLFKKYKFTDIFLCTYMHFIFRISQAHSTPAKFFVSFLVNLN